MRNRRICVLTGTRAEYGLLRWLMEDIRQDDVLQLQLLVTGMHLSPEFGLTYKQIEADGFDIDEKVEILMSSDTPVGIAKSMGIGVIGFAEALQRLNPDILVLLGDRFEILAAAQAAMVARIPIAHIHGGEATEGLIDESIRHAVTKMSHLHFVAAEGYGRRVVRMGEQPSRVFPFGAPGLDSMRRLGLLPKEELEASLGLKLAGPIFLVTYHPLTLSAASPAEAFGALLQALDAFPEARMIITKANSDTGGRIINELAEQYAAERSDRVKVFASLGQLRYLSLLQYVDAVVGNSSSGLIEAPVFRKAAVNIGKRQDGRLKADSVIDCAETKDAIVDALRKALSAPFGNVLRQTVSLYGSGDASVQIKNCLKTADLNDILFKKFYEADVKA